MRRREFIGCVAASAIAATQHKPSIVLILADDLGYGELGCQGNPQIPTPNIDSIAKAGVRFTNGYVTAPYCSPSRAGLLTGRYQTRFGHEMNPVGKNNLLPQAGLPLGEKSLANYLKDAGYRTALVGKWHLGGAEKYHPMDRGFDEFFGFLHEGHFYVPAPYVGVTSHLRAKEPPYDDDNPLMRGRDVAREPEYLTTAIGREAAAFIDRNQHRPFFLYVPFNSVHSPMQATDVDMKRFAHIEDQHRHVFAAMLASMDDAVGAILKKLRERKLEQDTLVIFLSDNGGPVQELTSSNAPLRGQKGQLYEGGIRIPFMMQWPARLRGGRVVDEPVISCDIVPTVLAAAGTPAPERTDGVDLTPFLTGKRTKPPHETLFWRYGRARAVRRGNWKLVRQVRPRDPHEGTWELFDLARDIAEGNNLAEAQPARVQELAALWESMNRDMSPPNFGA